MNNEAFIHGVVDELSKHGGLPSALKGKASGTGYGVRRQSAHRLGREAGLLHGAGRGKGELANLLRGAGKLSKEQARARLAKKRTEAHRKGLDHDYR